MKRVSAFTRPNVIFVDYFPPTVGRWRYFQYSNLICPRYYNTLCFVPVARRTACNIEKSSACRRSQWQLITTIRWVYTSSDKGPLTSSVPKVTIDRVRTDEITKATSRLNGIRLVSWIGTYRCARATCELTPKYYETRLVRDTNKPYRYLIISVLPKNYIFNTGQQPRGRGRKHVHFYPMSYFMIKSFDLVSGIIAGTILW